MHTADSSRALLILVLICTAYLLIPFHRMTPSIMSAAIMSETGMGDSAREKSRPGGGIFWASWDYTICN